MQFEHFAIVQCSPLVRRPRNSLVVVPPV